MTISSRKIMESQALKQAPWWEILLIMALSLGITLVSPSLKLISILIPVAYLIADRHFCHRTWTDIGFNIRDIPSGLLKTIGWVLLVGLVIQAIAAFGSYYFLPEYAQHIIARLPFEAGSLNTGLFIALGISTLGEEIIYRALFQERMTAFLPPAAAIILSSLVFAIMHFAPGPGLIVLIDLLSVFVDSLVFGVIFLRTHNVFVAWIAHFLADIAGLLFILMIA